MLYKAEILNPAKKLRLQQSEEMETCKTKNFWAKSRSKFETSRTKKSEAMSEFSNPTSLLTKFSVISMRVASPIFEFLIRIGFVKKSVIKFRKLSTTFEDTSLALQ